jgi:ribonuclease R
MSERRADEATRDVVNWLKCEFMKDRVGESFPGVITAVTGFGLFVELTDIFVEGLVHVTALPGDYYHFDPVHHKLAGERTGRNFRLGDTVEVRVMRVDLDERKIDFEIAQTTLDAPNTRKGRLDAAPAKAPANKGRAEKPSGKAKGGNAHPAETAYAKDKAPSSRGPSKREAEKAPTPDLKPPRRSSKADSGDAYRASDAAAKNAEVRKSREMKKALLSEAKGSAGSAAKSGDSKGPAKHRKGPSKSSGARKPKAKS